VGECGVGGQERGGQDRRKIHFLIAIIEENL